MFSAGSSRTLVFAVSTSTPCSRQYFTISAAGFSGSNPIMRPMPVTLLIPGASVRAAKIFAERARTTASASASRRENMLTAPAQATGLPPKVEP